MNNRKTTYRTPLMFCIALLAIFICCAAFIGCPEADEMTDGVITLPEDIPPPPPEDRPLATSEMVLRHRHPQRMGKGDKSLWVYDCI